MPTYKLVLEYVGTRFVGWQIQPSEPTVQGDLIGCLRRLFDDPELQVAGAARTDSGTHAHGQVASFTSGKIWDPMRLRHALNRMLPEDIGVVESSLEEERFHARRSATGRIYRYQIATGDALSPFMAPFVHHHRADLDAGAMAEGATCLVGEHDFSSFRASGDVSSTSVKRIWRSDVRREGPLVIYTVAGTSFLQHMVRTIAGTLVEVGCGRRPPTWVGEVLEARDRAAAGPTLPARGLFLDRVLYGPAPALPVRETR